VAYEIESYQLMYDLNNEKPKIVLRYFNDDGQPRYASCSPSPENAIFIADLLRNEKPVYYYKKQMLISTSNEEVGEEET